MKYYIRRLFSILCCLGLLMFFSACEDQGPAEKAGEQLDEAAEQTQEKIEEAGEKMQEAVEEGGEKIEEGVEDIQGD